MTISMMNLLTIYYKSIINKVSVEQLLSENKINEKRSNKEIYPVKSPRKHKKPKLKKGNSIVIAQGFGYPDINIKCKYIKTFKKCEANLQNNFYKHIYGKGDEL